MNGFKHMNQLGKDKIPFLFMVDYNKADVRVYPLKELNEANDIKYQFHDISNFENPKVLDQKVQFEAKALAYPSYKKQFLQVKEALQEGNTYLLNLTASSPIQTNLSLLDIFHLAKSPFKMWVKGQFTFFSPESFIEIKNNTLSTFPMKGTIDANLPNAEATILADEKETAEHNTIIDLLRNDISMIGTNTRVKKYRYVEEINTHKGKLMQVSSQINAELSQDWNEHIGTYLDLLTPAGSITGAPKQKTCELIAEIEEHERGFYTGVSGIFTGETLYSAVMIRFIEQTKKGFVFKSGGGIHNLSQIEDEYQELIQKVYLPF